MLRSNGRYSGSGIEEDDYSEEFCYRRFGERSKSKAPVRLPNDHVKPEELNGEVVIIQPGKKNKEDT